MVHVTAGLIPLASNFLVPNGTFFVELIAFAIIVWILAKFVIPPINRAMTARQDAIRQEFADLDEAKADGPQGRGGVQGADRRRPPRGRQDPRGGPRAGRRRSSPRCASRPRPRPHASSSTATHRSRPSVSRPWPRCAPRSARWPSTSPAGSSGESLDDDERSTRVVDRFLADVESMQAAEATAQDGDR